jgi:5-methylcytosine-specific restriction endonuclease McrA
VWSKLVKERDNYTCRDCWYIGNDVVSHHKEEWKQNKEKRYELNNWTTLCVDCHSKKHILISNFIKNGKLKKTTN